MTKIQNEPCQGSDTHDSHTFAFPKFSIFTRKKIHRSTQESSGIGRDESSGWERLPNPTQKPKTTRNYMN